MKERVHKTLEALEACSGRSCGLCPYTAPRTSACERMLKADAAALVADLWGIISQPVQNAAQEVQPFTRASILEAARKCVCGEREGEYGTPEDNFAHIANLWGDLPAEGLRGGRLLLPDPARRCGYHDGPDEALPDDGRPV